MEKVNVMELHVGETFVSAKSGVTLTVASVNRDTGVVQATQDGAMFQRGVWQTAADLASDVEVWAEVWGLGGCEFHGTVDSRSRKVTQVG
jgi:hypothetical protein